MLERCDFDYLRLLTPTAAPSILERRTCYLLENLSQGLRHRCNTSLEERLCRMSREEVAWIDGLPSCTVHSLV